MTAFFGDPFVQFYLIGFFLFLPIFSFKSIFLKICLIIYAYPLWILAGLYVGIPASRIVQSVGLPHYEQYLGAGFFIALIGYLSYLVALYPIAKQKFTLLKFPLSFMGRLLVFGLLISFTMIAYPNAMGVGDTRFGSLGSLVVIFVSIIIVSENNRKSKSILYYLLLFFLFFMVTRGERVDFILGVIALLILDEKNKAINLYKVIPAVTIIFILGVFAGLNRSGINITFMELITLASFSLVNFGTAVDVVHVYMSSIWYFYEVGISHLPLINLVSSYIPFSPWSGASHEFNFSMLIRDDINNVGGGNFYLVGVLAGGIIGVMIFGFLLGWITKKLFTLKYKYSSFIFIAFFIMQFRIQWYGATYFGSVLFCCTLLFLFLHYLNKKCVIKKKMIKRQQDA